MTVALIPTVGGLRRHLAARLETAFAAEGREGTPGLDARLLLGDVLGVDASGLIARDTDPIDPEAEARALDLVERRIAGEPVARILGRQEFWGLDFRLGPDTLVPRPDTETLVEAALGFIDATGGRDRPLRLLDIGTGSGAILLSLLHELPAASGVGTDCAGGALAVAAGNVRRLGLDGRAQFLASDWAGAAAGARFDLVLANPPYIASDAIAGLQVEVRRFEPRLALDGGADGLDADRAILADLGRLLARGGRGFIEIGYGQARDIAELAGKHGFSARFHDDLGGIARVAEIAVAGDG